MNVNQRMPRDLRRMRQLKTAAKVADLGARKPLAISKRLRREIMAATDGLEPDPDVRLICPVVARKLWGTANPGELTSAQRRKVGSFAREIIKTLVEAGRIAEFDLEEHRQQSPTSPLGQSPTERRHDANHCRDYRVHEESPRRADDEGR